MPRKSILRYFNPKTHWRAVRNAYRLAVFKRRNGRTAASQRRIPAEAGGLADARRIVPFAERGQTPAVNPHAPHSVSICIATRNHVAYLRKTLDSIFQQLPIPGQPVEVIVVDDGSDDGTPEMLKGYSVRRFRLENAAYGNGGLAKNMGLRAAAGDIIIQQSDDVLHATPNLIQELTADFRPGEFRIATVYDFDTQWGRVLGQYAGCESPRPLFFLGALWREDICRLGGYDPEFDGTIWYNDDWHGDGLVRGLGLECVHVPLLGLHQAHPRPQYQTISAKALYRNKCKRAKASGDPALWLSSAGPWPYVQGKSVSRVEAEKTPQKVA